MKRQLNAALQRERERERESGRERDDFLFLNELIDDE